MLKRDFGNAHFFCTERKKTARSRNPLAWRYAFKQGQDLAASYH